MAGQSQTAGEHGAEREGEGAEANPTAAALAAARDDRGRLTAGLLTHLDRHQRLHRQSRVLGDADMRLLWLFSDARERTLREIADDLHLEQSTVNRQVNAALAEGLLERSRPEGSTAYRFYRTQAGHDLFEADVAATLGGYREALDSMGEPAATDLLRLLMDFTEAYRRVAEGADEALHPDSD